MKDYITKQVIRKYGYDFEDEQYEKMFLDFLNEELTGEVGTAISKSLTTEQIKEVNKLSERLSNNGDGIEIIEKYLSDEISNYTDIVEATVKRFYRKLIFNRNSIMKKYQKNKGGEVLKKI